MPTGHRRPLVPKQPPVLGVWLENELLTVTDREWTCQTCGTRHDRDPNAALNLQRLATATALPVASPSGNCGREGLCRSRGSHACQIRASRKALGAKRT
ncbi:MAG: zinc ribbon domain-containing protein, partial [Thermochromatium sp.]